MRTASRRRPSRSARRRRRERMLRNAAICCLAPLALWLLIRQAAGPGLADYSAGVATGAGVCALFGAVLRARADRWARRAGLSARAAASRPVKRVPRPARTPIHDSAEHQMRST